ncbi:MAG: thioredoxin [Betaproteobacteria bacterium]
MDVTTATFEAEVLEASKTLPVVVDFWAPWCGPCRALTPVLEKLALEYAGRVKLVKVNSDDNQDLSQAFAIRSIPNVIAFRNGKPVAQFMGAQPEGQVRAFFDKLLPTAADLALAAAEAHYAAGRLEEAEAELAKVQPNLDTDARVEALKQGIVYARAGKGGPGEAELKARLVANPDDHESRAALAALYGANSLYREAMDELLEIVRRAKDWKEGEARKQMLALFTLAAAQPELVSEYRRKLSSALY